MASEEALRAGDAIPGEPSEGLSCSKKEENALLLLTKSYIGRSMAVSSRGLLWRSDVVRGRYYCRYDGLQFCEGIFILSGGGRRAILRGSLAWRCQGAE